VAVRNATLAARRARGRQVDEVDAPFDPGDVDAGALDGAAGVRDEAAGLSAAEVLGEESEPPEPESEPPVSVEPEVEADDSLGTVAEPLPDLLSVL
jgi:hypothetical protein